jgi:hypothetical protein
MVDYGTKLENKNKKIPVKVVNEVVTILNYCFKTKNDFFVSNFNKKNIKNVYEFYSQFKSNILNEEIKDLFAQIQIENLKVMRFIMINLIKNFGEIVNANEQSDHEQIENELCGISKDSISCFIKVINNQINEKIGKGI